MVNYFLEYFLESENAYFDFMFLYARFLERGIFGDAILPSGVIRRRAGHGLRGSNLSRSSEWNFQGQICGKQIELSHVCETFSPHPSIVTG